MTGSDELRGGCLCGAIRYCIEGEPRVVGDCHCSMCRRVSGAAYVTWVTVLRERVAWEGEPAWFASSEHGARGFCATCGTHVLARSAHYERYYDIPAGTLDQPDRVRPLRHVFAVDRVGWHELDWSLPAHAADAGSSLIEPPNAVSGAKERGG